VVAMRGRGAPVRSLLLPHLREAAVRHLQLP
jgi:hypothetical protein